MSPTPSELTAFRFAGFTEPSWLLWRQPTSMSAWTLAVVSDGSTRLATFPRAEEPNVMVRIDLAPAAEQPRPGP